MTAILAIPIPAESALSASVATSSFHDAYSAPVSERSMTPT
jgi:hypothetical protein